MSLPEKAIKEFQEIYKKNYGKELSYPEASEAANNLVGLVKILHDADREEFMLQRKLKDSPKGFHIMDGKIYSCGICHMQIKDKELWYDKWGKKCLACQDAVNKKKIPGSICYNDKVWYATWELESDFKLKSPTVRKLARQGILKARIIPKSGFHVFLLKENQGILPPKDIVGYISVPVKGTERTIRMTPWYEVKDPKKTLEQYKIWPYLTELQKMNKIQ